MIHKEGTFTKTLLDYHDGKIEMGLGVGIDELDLHLRFKRGQLVPVLGHDNVGKTFWFLWYALCLSSNHGITWTMYLAENKPWSAIRDLIQFYTGKQFKDLTKEEITRYQSIIESWFKFVDNKELYTPEALLEIFKSSDSDAFFIDPFTALDRQFGYEANYVFLNKTRQFCNETNKTVYLSSHPTSESGRSGRLYPKDHDWEGYLMPPMKDMIEGGKAFSNRVDDFIIVHRLIDHVGDMRYKTMIDIKKVKDSETGGRITGKDCPILCEYNSGLGFKIGWQEGIKRIELSKSVKPNMDFDDCPF